MPNGTAPPTVAAKTYEVLLVEDSAGDASLVSEQLAQVGTGVGVTTVTTLAAARAALDRSSFDCILLALTLPDGDGLDALAAALGGTQSLHTNGFDEALGLPTEQAAKLALRTQQVVGYESGVADTVDPLGGSYFVERLERDEMPLAGLILNRVHESPATRLSAARSLAAAETLTGTREADPSGIGAVALRLHAERMRRIASEQRLAQRFTAAHPLVPVAEILAQPDDVHDLAGLRAIGSDFGSGR